MINFPKVIKSGSITGLRIWNHEKMLAVHALFHEAVNDHGVINSILIDYFRSKHKLYSSALVKISH